MFGRSTRHVYTYVSALVARRRGLQRGEDGGAQRGRVGRGGREAGRRDGSCGAGGAAPSDVRLTSIEMNGLTLIEMNGVSFATLPICPPRLFASLLCYVRAPRIGYLYVHGITPSLVSSCGVPAPN